MPGAESRADATLPCRGWYTRWMGVSAMGVGERSKSIPFAQEFSRPTRASKATNSFIEK